MPENVRKTAALHNLGCKVNAYETEAMQQMLTEAGYVIVPFPEPADVYVINTCTVTNVADKKSRQMIHRARKANPDAVIVAAGCYVQMKPDRMNCDDAADIILGNNRKTDLINILKDFEDRRSGGKKEPGADRIRTTDRSREVCVSDINDNSQPYEELSVFHPAEHTRAFVKVQDGCNNFCSYCIIPYARGRARSRDPEQVIAEVEELAKNGFLEIVLTGIHLSSYGIDRGDSLIGLIRRIHAVEGVRRIRLSSLEPGIITEEFVAELSGMEKVCPHFHLSLQSGSDTVLARMNRKYTAEEYLEKCDILRRYYEHPALTTDVIVGFPGETDEEFAETCAFVKRAAFYGIHVFRYSKREGTAAARMDGQVPAEVSAERSAGLLKISAGLRKDFERWYEGRQVKVLFEERVDVDGEQCWTGLTPEYIRVYFPSDEMLGNRIADVPCKTKREKNDNDG